MSSFDIENMYTNIPRKHIINITNIQNYNFPRKFCMGVKIGLETSREEHRLRVYENSILRRIYGHKRNENIWTEEERNNTRMQKTAP
jgi:hypothetical protein